MTQEDKELLLKDLCARLPYGVIIHLVEPNEDEELYCLNIPQEGLYTRSLEHNNVTTLSPIEDVKPYLRPMSNMIEEERKELKKLCEEDLSEFAGFIRNGHGLSHDGLYMFDKLRQLEFCLSHHFDYRGLIEKGLALQAPKDMYDIKEK